MFLRENKNPTYPSYNHDKQDNLLNILADSLFPSR